MSSLIVAVGERRGSLGVGFKNIICSWVMKSGVPAGTGRGHAVVASRWLGGGKAKAQGREIG